MIFGLVSYHSRTVHRGKPNTLKRLGDDGAGSQLPILVGRGERFPLTQNLSRTSFPEKTASAALQADLRVPDLDFYILYIYHFPLAYFKMCRLV